MVAYRLIMQYTVSFSQGGMGRVFLKGVWGQDLPQSFSQGGMGRVFLKGVWGRDLPQSSPMLISGHLYFCDLMGGIGLGEKFLPWSQIQSGTVERSCHLAAIPFPYTPPPPDQGLCA